MSDAVVDASVAVKWFVAEVESDLAARLLLQKVALSAPALLLTELANALWNRWRRSLIPADLADAAIQDVWRYLSRWVQTEPLLPEAMRLSRSLDHPIYDCCYLVLARREDAPLLTADKRL